MPSRIRGLTSILAALASSLLVPGGHAAVPLELWPVQAAAPAKTALQPRLDQLNAALPSLPEPLKPALQFEKIFLQITSGALPAAWQGEIEKLSTLPGGNPVADGVREVSKAWLARLQMIAIHDALHLYYRAHVRFPATLAEIENNLPETLRKDPWGAPWTYSPRAPQGFGQLAAQRYQLGPARFPHLSSLADAVRHRPSSSFAWTLARHDIAGATALEFHSVRPGAPSPLLQPGGKVEAYTLLFIGDNWALIAGPDQLFAVEFK